MKALSLLRGAVLLSLLLVVFLSVFAGCPGERPKRCNPFDPDFDPTCACQTNQDCPDLVACRDGLCLLYTEVTSGDGGALPEPTPADTPEPAQPCTNEGESRSCYAGPPGTIGKGRCLAGQQTCQNGLWQPCVGQVLPRDELCNKEDDDCDGQTDEEDPNNGSICQSGGVGRCSAGTLLCKSGRMQCQGNSPAQEVCNGQDDDCNGQIDDNLTGGSLGTSCTFVKGTATCQGRYVCEKGVITCEALPVSETCNGQDDDCDGEIDETFACPRAMSYCQDLGTIGSCRSDCSPSGTTRPCASTGACYQGRCIACTCDRSVDRCLSKNPSAIFTCGLVLDTKGKPTGQCDWIVGSTCPSGRTCSQTNTSAVPTCR